MASPSIPPLIMQLSAALAEALHDRLPESGFPDIRPPHCQVLRGIEPGGSRLTDLAAAARMTKQSMGALVDHLEAAGYLERVPDRDDARVKAIRLTARGQRAAQAIAEIGARIEAEWAQKIGRKRLEQLREALAAIATRSAGTGKAPTVAAVMEPAAPSQASKRVVGQPELQARTWLAGVMRRKAARVGNGAGSGATGSVLAAVGGFLVTVGAPLPWERVAATSSSPPVPGCFGCGGAAFVFYGTQMANGKIAMAAGAVLAMAGLFMLAYPAARRWCAVVLACAVVVTAAEVGGWWLNNLPVAVGSVGAMEACGVLLGLAAVPLCLPGPVRKRASLLAATVLLCVIGVALVRPGSVADFVVY